MAKNFFIAFTIIFLIVLVEGVANMADAIVNQDRIKFVFLNGILFCNCMWLAAMSLLYLFIIRREEKDELL